MAPGLGDGTAVVCGAGSGCCCRPASGRNV